MIFGISLNSIIPLRSEPSHKSEMVSQVLFGELFKTTFSEKGWVHIKLSYDSYEGWVEAKQITYLNEGEFLRLLNANTPCSYDLVQLLLNETKNTVVPVLIGSSLPGIKDGRFSINGDTFYFDGSFNLTNGLETFISNTERIKIKQDLVKDSLTYLNSPYCWGGRSPFGIDCSGFTQMVYKLKNIKILRDASLQAGHGEPLSFITEAEPGDLVFFDDDEGNISHVGIIIDKTHIIHASGKVRIDTIDHEGIYNEEEQRYTHKLRVIKRII